MGYLELFNLLPEIGMKETRSITINGNNSALPLGDYAIVELYCDDPTCDCRRVILSVCSPQYKKSLAFITYGWESINFYARKLHMNTKNLSESDRRFLGKLKGPCLDPLIPQSNLASDALKLVVKYAINDKEYIDRVKRHYKLFKEEIKRLHVIKEK